MTEAMKGIVDGYVRRSNRTALEDLVAHHRLLLKGLEAQSNGPGMDINAPMVRVIEEEIAIINAGLERLCDPIVLINCRGYRNAVGGSAPLARLLFSNAA
jgi:hypothetical protein